MTSNAPRPTVTAMQRKEALSQAIKTAVVQGGRVESQNDYDAVIVEGHKVNHVLHFLIGLFTLGIWWIVWIILALTGGEKRKLISVDEYGETLVQRL